jgi:hypothetical protein
LQKEERSGRIEFSWLSLLLIGKSTDIISLTEQAHKNDELIRIPDPDKESTFIPCFAFEQTGDPRISINSLSRGRADGGYLSPGWQQYPMEGRCPYKDELILSLGNLMLLLRNGCLYSI